MAILNDASIMRKVATALKQGGYKQVKDTVKAVAGAEAARNMQIIDGGGPDGLPALAMPYPALLQAADEFVKTLREFVAEAIPGFDTSAIIRRKPRQDAASKAVIVEVVFKQSALRRSSLDPQRYPRGVEDIVALFSKGYGMEAELSPVYGEWHGRRVQSKTSRPPNRFIFNAVSIFNASEAAKHGARAEIVNPKYQ